MKKALGTLEKVDLREVWESENEDFTPWLAREENINKLGQKIGLDLEVEAQEKRVGKFRADILCKDINTDNWVLIENQLEKTNHGHLGQLLTYATGLDAVTIVWVAATFNEEHKATLDWLNKITDENYNFFGLEIELYKIEDSKIAPKFNLVCQPDNWSQSISREAKRIEQGEVSETKLKQYKFWTELGKELQAADTPLKLQKVYPQHWTNIAVGKTGVHLGATFNTQQERVSAQLYIIKNKNWFKELESQKDIIEKELGEKLSWQLLPEKAASRIALYRSNSDIENTDDWKEMLKWLVLKLEKLRIVFSPRLKNLRLDSEEGN
tara:strand:+ start:159 stop:1130 length:972 start_codon:yes stop_codon:yes gene_type:complete